MKRRNINATVRTHLNTVQGEINAKPNFTAKAAYAEVAWRNRTNNAAFNFIYNKLINMCVHNKVCNYCESTEATDIEHVLPKSLFPERAFVWTNYILVCKTCNTEYKLDKMSVFNPSGSATVFPVPRKMQPPTDDVAIINIRFENPEHFIDLDLDNGIFFERQAAGTVDYEKAKFTIDDALKLNLRQDILEDRINCYKNQYRNLKYAVKVFESTDFDQLDEAINDHEPEINIDRTKTLKSEKDKFLKAIKNTIKAYKHPTVWKEMKKQRATIPKLNDLFNRFREAENW